MTRQGMLNQYQVNEKGIITSPGKFEGERVYVPYLWEFVVDGFAVNEFTRYWEEDILEGSELILDEDDLKEFPELAEDGYKRGDSVCLGEDDNGFVFFYYLGKGR